MIHPQSDWLHAWIRGSTAFGVGPYCTSLDQTFVLLCMWLYEAHNDLRHHNDGNEIDVKASILAFFSEHSLGNSRAFRARRVAVPQPVVHVPPAQIEPGLAALPAPPVFVVARRDEVLGAAGPPAQG